jgi:uncharacterized Zn-binding protein involved in type VI secretion
MKIARVGYDSVAGHPFVNGSKNVFIQGKPMVTVGTGVTNDGKTMVGGSGTVYANGHRVCRVGDSDSRGRAISASSSTVYANGSK